MVIQCLCNTWVLGKDHAGFWHMKRSDGLNTAGNVCPHACSKLAAVCIVGHKRHPQRHVTLRAPDIRGISVHP